VTRRAAWIVTALLATPALAVADDPPDLAAARDLDPMTLARAVDRGGDDLVLGALAGEPSVGAVNAAPFMTAPELALPRLVELAAGRDPWLAPQAMRAVVQIAERPLRQEMTRREADPAQLDAVIESLEALEADEAARADLRVGAALARQQLGG